ncbi:hypothetical protein HOY80DRAFT_289859 [Tuber brumale]|nr:hypothetical protein HOY80DRAFT_289859 [Tuber brumale]
MSTILFNAASRSIFRRLATVPRKLPAPPGGVRFPRAGRPITTTPTPAHNHTSLIPGPASINGLAAIPYYSQYGLSPIVRAFRSYGNAQRKRPYITQLLTSVAIYALGDLNAQLLFGGDEKYDALRTGRMVMIGSVFSIPSYLWFTKLGQSFNFRSKILAISTRVLVNQVFFTPLFLCAFFTLQNTFQAGRFVSPKETVERLRKTIPAAYGNSCKLWPAVTAVNFWIVPFEYRALFGGVVAVGWNGYLSYLNQAVQTTVIPATQPVEIPVAPKAQMAAQKPLTSFKPVVALV